MKITEIFRPYLPAVIRDDLDVVGLRGPFDEADASASVEVIHGGNDEGPLVAV